MGPADLERRMRRAYLPMTSNSVIVRRAALLASGGYRTRLEWYADSFAYTIIALRHGACVVPQTLALLRANPESYSARGRRDARRERAMAHAVLGLHPGRWHVPHRRRHIADYEPTLGLRLPGQGPEQ